MNWLPIDQAPENVVVETKVDDGRSGRYRLPLIRRGTKWYQPGGEATGDGFVFYRPTHFLFIEYAPTAGKWARYAKR